MYYMERIEDDHISGPIKANLDEIKELQKNRALGVVRRSLIMVRKK